MGTRSLTHVVDDRGNILLTLYRQYDGYPSGMGADIFEFAKNFRLVNGIPLGTDDAVMGKMANGMGCFSAQLVKHLKDCLGNVYIYPPLSSDCLEEYTYFVGPKDDKVVVYCADGESVFEINEESIEADGPTDSSITDSLFIDVIINKQRKLAQIEA